MCSRAVLAPVLLACTLLPATTEAQEHVTHEARESQAIPSKASLRAEFYVGGGFGGAALAAFGGDILGRYEWVEGGPLCQAIVFLPAITAPEGWSSECGGALGMAPRIQASALGFDVLMVLGVRHWSGVGSRTLAGPSAEGTVPSAGLRVGATAYIANKLALSAWLGFDDDLVRKHVLLGDSASSGEVVIGRATAFAALRIGLQFDVQ